jgi:Uma2 family endonuclease
MIAMSTTALMTFAEFEQLPDTPGKQELIDGELVSMPPPELKHTQIIKRVYHLFWRNLPESRVWPDHTGYRISRGWIEPDVSVSWPDQKQDDKYFVGAPMIAVEILSPGEDIERKLTLYFAEGALEVWVISIKHKAMAVYVRREQPVIRLDVVESYWSEAAQVSLSLTELFAGVS